MTPPFDRRMPFPPLPQAPEGWFWTYPTWELGPVYAVWARLACERGSILVAIERGVLDMPGRRRNAIMAAKAATAVQNARDFDKQVPTQGEHRAVP